MIEHPFRKDLCTLDPSSQDLGPGAPRVYYINAAWGDPQAEVDLAHLLEDILAKTSVTLMCVESRVGECSLSGLHSVASQPCRQSVGKRYLGRSLGAAEYLSLAWLRALSLWGVEESAEAIEKVNSDFVSLGQDHAFWQALFGGTSDLAGAAPGSLCADLEAKMPRPHVFGAIDVAASSRIQNIFYRAKELDISTSRQLREVFHVIELEGQIDFARANDEAAILGKKLQDLLAQPDRILEQSLRSCLNGDGDFSARGLASLLNNPNTDWTRLARGLSETPAGLLIKYSCSEGKPESAGDLLSHFYAACRAVTGRLAELAPRSQEEARQSLGFGSYRDHATFFRLLVELRTLFQIPAEEIHNVIKAAQYYWWFNQSDIAQHLFEVERLYDAIIDRLASESERRYFRLRRTVEKVAQLLTMRVTNADLDEIDREHGSLRHEELCAALGKWIHGSVALRRFKSLGKAYSSRLEAAKSWYRHQKKRQIAMADITLGRMADGGESQAILVTGGFHKEVVAARLIDRGLSCWIFTPVIRRAIPEKVWEIHMKGTRRPGLSIDRLIQELKECERTKPGQR